MKGERAKRLEWELERADRVARERSGSTHVRVSKLTRERLDKLQARPGGYDRSTEDVISELVLAELKRRGLTP